MKKNFGPFGGQFVAETLMHAIDELSNAYGTIAQTSAFRDELSDLLQTYANRPSRLYHAKRMSDDLKTTVLLKREDLNHTGAHKINNVLGQTLLAHKMGKRRVIAETGAGQHGVATATAAALFGMACDVFMGVEDMARQAINVYRMQLLGACVHAVEAGTGTLKDATSEALREWSRSCDDTYYVIGSVVGPAPYPEMVRDFQRVIGDEIKDEMLDRYHRLPTALFACVGGGSNAIGTFYSFIDDPNVRLIAAEAAGEGLCSGRHAASISGGTVGVFHGMKSLFLQDDEGQITPVYSISAGMDYPGIGPEHAFLHTSGRARYEGITDEEAVDSFEYLSRTEGIIPAIESAHAVALLRKLKDEFSPDDMVVVTLSGRGDKDVEAIGRYRNELTKGALV